MYLEEQIKVMHTDPVAAAQVMPFKGVQQVAMQTFKLRMPLSTHRITMAAKDLRSPSPTANPPPPRALTQVPQRFIHTINEHRQRW